MLPHSSPEWIRSPPPRIGQSGTSGMSGVTRSAACCVCALSPSTVFSRFLWVTATVGASFLFVRNGAEWSPCGMDPTGQGHVSLVDTRVVSAFQLLYHCHGQLGTSSCVDVGKHPGVAWLVTLCLSAAHPQRSPPALPGGPAPRIPSTCFCPSFLSAWARWPLVHLLAGAWVQILRPCSVAPSVPYRV